MSKFAEKYISRAQKADAADIDVIEFKVKLTTFEDVNNFNRIACRQDFVISLSTGIFTVDAKSILGIYSLDLGKDLTVKCYVQYAEDARKFLTEICNYAIHHEE